MSRLITRRRSVTEVAPSLSASTAPSVSAPLTGEPTPLTEATPTASQVPVSSTSSVSIQPLSARRPHRRCREPEPSDHTSLASRVEDEASHPAKKTTRGPSRMLKSAQSWDSWEDIPQRTKELVRDKLSVVFDLKDISPEAMAYLEEGLATRYKHWNNYLHTHFQRYDDPEVARLHGCPIELKDRPEDWEWLCKHFTDPKFVKKSLAGKKARDSKTLLHHSGSKPFSYRLDARCQGVLSSQRSTRSRKFTFDLEMRSLSTFMLLWWKSALLLSKKQHHSFPWIPRSRTSRYPRMQVFRS